MVHALSVRAVAVLVVDDGPQNRALMRQLLESMGCHVTTGSSGERGIEAAELQDFDVALLDLHMPGLDGRATSMQIRDARRAAGCRPRPMIVSRRTTSRTQAPTGATFCSTSRLRRKISGAQQQR